MGLQERDSRSIWHPATHFDDLAAVPPIGIVRAKGAWLYTEGGDAILDAISSWWTSIHGHNHPRIVAAIREQADQLDHVMFAGFTHEPAVALAESLLAAAGPEFGRVFYADSGADAVEIALKLSVQYHQQTGAPQRRRFAALQRGYHGETLGALGVCGSSLYRDRFAYLLHDALFLPSPHQADHRHDDLVVPNPQAVTDATTQAALDLLSQHADELAAVILEPVVQCAGKMAMPGIEFYARIVQHARALGIQVIADEVAVGFGRTGRLFAWQWSDLAPDYLVIGKGLSGGALPLSAVVIRTGIDGGFSGDAARSFAHSHTYCANPIACAAGVASLQLLHESVLPVLQDQVESLARAGAEVAAARQVSHYRQAGCILAFDLQAPPELARVGLNLRRAALQRGVLLRPLGDTLYWMPPLTITEQELERLVSVTLDVITEVLP